VVSIASSIGENKQRNGDFFTCSGLSAIKMASNGGHYRAFLVIKVILFTLVAFRCTHIGLGLELQHFI
jgi:hypothetical protein